MDSDGRFSTFIFPDASPGQVYLVVAIIIFLVVLAVIAQIVYSKRVRQKNKAHSLRLMQEIIVDRQLTGEQGKLLTAWAIKYHPRDIIALTSNHRVFEECMQRGIWENRTLNDYDKTELLESIAAIRRKLGFDKTTYGRALGSSKEIPAYQRVRLEIKREGGQETYETRVAANSETALTLERPRKEGQYVALSGTETVAVSFFRAGDGEYVLKSGIHSLGTDTINIHHTTQMERSQQRGAVRVDLSIPVTFYVVPSPKYPDRDAPVLRPEDAIRGTLKDLSTGGAKLEVLGDMPAGAKYVNLKFTIHGTVFENVTAEILKQVGAGSLKFINVKFRTISENEQNTMFSLIAQEQIWQKGGTT